MAISTEFLSKYEQVTCLLFQQLYQILSIKKFLFDTLNLLKFFKKTLFIRPFLSNKWGNFISNGGPEGFR